MKLKNVRIGTEFQTSEGRLWRVTDVGTRTLSAIVIETPERTLPDGIPDASWLNGPPYIVEEVLFDEQDIDGAFVSADEDLLEDLRRRSAHPGFPNEIMGVLLDLDDRLAGAPTHPVPRILRFDRWDPSVMDVLHPYAARRTDDGWAVKVYRLFAKTFEERTDTAFVALKLARETHLRQARAHHRALVRSESPAPSKA